MIPLDSIDSRILQIADQFSFPAPVCRIMPWGNGLINQTFRIHTEDGGVFLMQQINTSVYTDIDGIMENIDAVTRAIGQNTFYFSDGREKPSIRLIPLKDGRTFYREEDGTAWRSYNFIRSAYCIERAGTAEQVQKIAFILGRFHNLLQDFPVESLNVVEKDFHNPMRHYRALQQAVARVTENDVHDHLAEVSEELAAIEAHAHLFDTFNQPQWADLPLRVNHNDPKINNIMVDIDSHEAICMVDFDTIMPGLLPYDFGDAVRSVMCTGQDDGPDTDAAAIHFNWDFYRIYKENFLLGAGDMLTQSELDSLDLGVRLILWESAMRYLADYLNGNVYLRVRYPEQNLIKARIHIHTALDLDPVL